MPTLEEYRHKLRQQSYANEEECVDQLLTASHLDQATSQAIQQQAAELIQRARKHRDQRGKLDAFLEEFGLTNREGVALMCLAEALLRIPDSDTADELIAELVHSGDWAKHWRHSDSLFVNTSVWGMMLTGKVVELDNSITQQPRHWLRSLVNRVSEPVVRQAMLQAMRIMGSHYVLGRSIDEALKRGPAENPPGTCFSFDMLGEGARTEADAQRYFKAYLDAIKAIAAAPDTDSEDNHSDTVTDANGISIKLSALHPRYRQSQQQQLMAELLPRVQTLALAAKAGNLGFNIDAEEAERLDISLDILEALARYPALQGWNGLGFVLQAYQKRAPFVADWLIALSRETGHRLMLRLVKGAYWDTEIKHAQELGLTDYPVYTRKANTDLCYLVCADKMLRVSDAIYPQFATHNAQTLATVIHMANICQGDYELQRLHGMGELLYDQLRKQCLERVHDMPRVRIYAPVGAHRDLLPYLVRRLLENGANSSFVHRFLNDATPIEQLTADVYEKVRSFERKRHPHISLPADLYRNSCIPRSNSPGINLEDIASAETCLSGISETASTPYQAGPIINGGLINNNDIRPVNCPAATDMPIGQVCNATAADIETALVGAQQAQASWNERGGSDRAERLEQIGALYSQHLYELVGLISREGGRTIRDALAEVREAIDFCHYYAALARQHFAEAETLTGPTGEHNQLSLQGRGVFLCISPWNFPLAIFTGQVVAALAAGNTVIAKPAEQTPLVAARAVALMHAAGIPGDVLQLITGAGKDIGPTLVTDSRISGVAFTGSTATAQQINRQLAAREGAIIPLIAETGGINAMIADSSALAEQLVDDVINSAFYSAGQRCSALRVLFLQEEVADSMLEMLFGACDQLHLGLPWQLSTDIGPVINTEAQASLLAHINHLSEEATLLYAYPASRLPSTGSFVGPHIFLLDNMQQLQGEVFGPILHIVRYQSGELDEVIAQINASGYGLTLGVHSRIDSRADHIIRSTRVGNNYINRNMVGAVVGVNPFGGQGLSGTGPKAGGPHYLSRFATEKTVTTNTTAKGGNIELFRQMDED